MVSAISAVLPQQQHQPQLHQHSKLNSTQSLQLTITRYKHNGNAGSTEALHTVACTSPLATARGMQHPASQLDGKVSQAKLNSHLESNHELAAAIWHSRHPLEPQFKIPGKLTAASNM